MLYAAPAITIYSCFIAALLGASAWAAFSTAPRGG